MADFTKKHYVDYAGLNQFWLNVKDRMYLKTEADAKFATQTALNEAIEGVNTSISTQLANYYNKTEIDGKVSTINEEIGKKLSTESFNTTIADYAKTADVNSAISTAKSDLTGLINGVDAKFASYYDKDAVDGIVEGLEGSIGDVDAKFAGYYTKGEADSAISGAVSAAQTTLQGNIDTLSNNLTNNYSTTTVVEGKISDAVSAQAALDKAAWEKADADLKSNLEGQIAALTHLSVEVVEALPESGELGVIYLVADTFSGSYVEYLWTGSAFEKIGTTKTDLKDYSTTEQMNAAISTALEPYAKTADVNASIKAVDDKLGAGFSSTDTVAAEFVKVRDEIKTLTDLGGEPNSIETVKVNGVALEIVEESVNIDLSAYDKIADRESAVNGVAARVKTLEDADFGKQISDAQSALQGNIDKKVDQSAYDAQIALLATTEALNSAVTGLKNNEIKAASDAAAAADAKAVAADGKAVAAGNAASAAQGTADSAVAMIGSGYSAEATVATDIAGVKAAYVAADTALETKMDEHIHLAYNSIESVPLTGENSIASIFA